MQKHGEEITVTEEEATNKTKPQGVRWILGISLALVIIVMTIAWISGTFAV